jgi:hypothetical protein
VQFGQRFVWNFFRQEMTGRQSLARDVHRVVAPDPWIFRLSKPGKKRVGGTVACRFASRTDESAGEVFIKELI